VDRVVQSLGRRPRALPLMTLAALSWGSGIVMTKITLEQLAPLDVLAVELVIGAGVVWAVLFARGGLGPLADWRAFAVLGLLEPGLSFALGDFGLDMTGAADGALLIASESLFAVLLARLVLNERLSLRAAVAVGVGFTGSLIIGLGQSGAGRATLIGDLLVLGGSAAAAAYTVAARRVARRGNPDAVTVTAVQLVVAAIVSMPLVTAAAAGGHSHLADADTAHLVAAVVTGLLSTAVPFLLYNVAIRDVQVAGAAVIGNLIPVMGAVLAVALLGESLAFLQVLGGVAIVLAAFGAEEQSSVMAAEQCQ
jgi:drug/metabolite transporter (DMT)-like permease